MATSQRGACNAQSVPKTDEKKVAQNWWHEPLNLAVVGAKKGQQPQLLSGGNLKVSGSIKLFGQDFDTHHIEEELLKWQIES